MVSETSGINRPSTINVELARYKPLNTWKPQIGDLVFWYGFFTKWVGVVTSFNGKNLTIVVEAFPSLLMTLDQSEYDKNTRTIDISKIRSSSKGEYNVLQDNIWYFYA